MNQPPQALPRSLRLGASAARLLWWLLVTAWLLLALAWGGLHGWIVPRIADYRPTLEAQASRALGAPVRIGAIRAYSSGLIPSFELQDVRLLDAQGRDALRLARVVAAVSPRSLWSLGFEQLYIDQPELDIRRSKEGRITVAGLDFSSTQGQDNRAADWFFSQTEFVIHRGTVRWTDELRGSPPLALREVGLVARNSARRHALHLQATPPAEWGAPFGVAALFRQPLLSADAGRWQDWSGMVYADFARVDVSQLQRYVNTGFELKQGQGALRAWADVRRGEVTNATADVALAGVQARLQPALPVLGLRNVTGRLAGRLFPGGFEFSTEALQFDTTEGLHWPGGNVFVNYTDVTTTGDSAKGELRADRLDLQALAQIANRLPLGTATHTMLLAHAPKGQIETLEASWHGSLGALKQYAVKGRVAGLALLAQPTGTPGVKGLSLDFSATQSGGQAKILLKNGSIELPGILSDPVTPFDEIAANASWQINGEMLSAEIKQLKFSNADTQGAGEARWHTSDPASSSSRSRFPGILDAQVQLSRGDGKRVHHYLPTTMSQEVRDYVRDAVVQGDLNLVKFRLKGDINDMPARPGKPVEFYISAQAQNVIYNYAPNPFPGAAAGAKALAWPALGQLSGELVFNGNLMQIKGASGNFNAAPAVQISRLEAQIADLSKTTVVEVSADARGPLADTFRLVLQSPLQNKLGSALARANLGGNADYKLQLSLPIRNIDKTRVLGTVLLANNDAQMTPETPVFTRARGTLLFTENGIALAGVQARALGGDVRLEGGSRAVLSPTAFAAVLQPGVPSAGLSSSEPTLAFRAQGSVTADGLRAANELALVSQLARYATGGTSYNTWFAFRQGLPEVAVVTNLQGLALSLPAPFSKAAEAALPLRYNNLLVRESLQADSAGALRPQDEIVLEIDRLASARYLRDVSGREAKVLRGQIDIGLQPDEASAPANQEIVANISQPNLDADAWLAVFASITDVNATANKAAAAAKGQPVAVIAADAAQSYLPTRLAIRAKQFNIDNRKLNNLVVGGSREGTTWRANLDANELNGYLEYRPSSANSAGRVYARLARLTVAPTSVNDVDALLDQQPASIPALDIMVEDFELRGKKLGRIEIEAVNRGRRSASESATGQGDGVREWRVNKFNVILPEATLAASGNWTVRGALAPTAAAGASEQRRTVMNFKLDVADSGKLLERLGTRNVIRGGAGTLQGQVGWLGSPLGLDYPSLTGQFNVNMMRGQFLQADPGLAKLLGVLSLQSLPRRLVLDFRDVFSDGFAFDFVRGDVAIDRGLASTNNLQMKGVTAAVLMEGAADIARETQDITAVVVPELNAGTASLITTIINPAVGIGSFLAQLFFRQPLIEAATQQFHITGTWADPKVIKVERRTAPKEPKAQTSP